MFLDWLEHPSSIATIPGLQILCSAMGSKCLLDRYKCLQKMWMMFKGPLWDESPFYKVPCRLRHRQFLLKRIYSLIDTNHTTLVARCVVSKYSHKQCYFCCVLVFVKIETKSKGVTVVNKGREWDKGESQYCVDSLVMTWSVVSEGWVWQQMRRYVHWHSSMLRIGTHR